VFYGRGGARNHAYCPHIFCPGDYILHYSCVPYTVGLITLLGIVTEENRVVKILAVILFIICVIVKKCMYNFFSR